MQNSKKIQDTKLQERETKQQRQDTKQLERGAEGQQGCKTARERCKRARDAKTAAERHNTATIRHTTTTVRCKHPDVRSKYQRDEEQAQRSYTDSRLRRDRSGGQRWRTTTSSGAQRGARCPQRDGSADTVMSVMWSVAVLCLSPLCGSRSHVERLRGISHV